MNQADIGIMSYFVPISEREKLLSKMVLAVKTVEYLAAGLPIIVNKYCGGAAYLIEKNKVGIAYDPKHLSELTEQSINFLLTSDIVSKSIKIAEDEFDYIVNAKKYAQIYTNLV